MLGQSIVKCCDKSMVPTGSAQLIRPTFEPVSMDEEVRLEAMDAWLPAHIVSSHRLLIRYILTYTKPETKKNLKDDVIIK